MKRWEGKSMLACACNPSIWEAEVGLAWSRLYSELEASLGYSIIPCLKKKKVRTDFSIKITQHGKFRCKMPEGFYVWRRWGCTSWGIHLINTPLLTGSWLLIVSMETVEHCFQLTLFLKNTIFFTLIFLLASEYEAVTLPVWTGRGVTFLSTASLSSVPAPNLQDIPFSKDLVPRQPEESLVRPELCCPSGGAFRWTWVCASCPRSSFRVRHLSICNDLPSPHGHNHPLKSWLLTSLILRHLSGFCL